MADIKIINDGERPRISSYSKKRPSFVLAIVVSLVFGVVGGFFGGGAYEGFKEKTDYSPGVTEEKKVELKETSDIIDVVKKVSPSVVSITGETTGFDFWGQIYESKSSGTGFIVEKNGLIITNKHVVSDQNANYSVFTSDGKEYKAKVKSLDPLNDIAFLEVEASDLPVVELGDSDKLEVGQKVIAIGNALGQYQNSVTTGVVSGIGRIITASDFTGASSETLENVIQTDAAINPGNSGGPLVNIIGQVIGINTAVDLEGQLIGFAIPINMAKSAIKSVIEKGRVIRPMIGVRYIPITKDFAASNNLSVSEGAFVYGGKGELAVIPGSPAAKAGIKEEDIITKVGDDKIDQNNSLAVLVQKYEVGEKVELTILRDGKETIIEVTLAEMKD